MSYRARPEKEKMRSPPGPWHKFIESLLVIATAISLNVAFGIGIYRLLKAWAPSEDCAIFAIVAAVLFSCGTFGAVISLAERRDW
jgi:hypothetical protein